MLTATELYPLLAAVLQAGGLIPHATARHSVAQHLAAVVTGQNLRPSARARALPSVMPSPARQRLRRGARALDRACLAPAALIPGLVRTVLALVRAAGAGPAPGQPWLLALDTVRCGRWEVFTVGVVARGRVLPVGWAVLPYPWPKGQFTPTVCALAARVGACWPPSETAVLLADRAFPSKALFGTLRRIGWSWTVRLQGRHAVTPADGRRCQVRELLAGSPSGAWREEAVTFGGGPDAPSGTLLIGPGLRVLPVHQSGPASLAARGRQAERRAQHVASKHPGRSAASHDGWVVLFTTEVEWMVAERQYRARWGIEGTYRDAQGGWDGRHGWALDQAAARLSTAARVEALAGLWALGVLVQTWLGLRVGTNAIGGRALRRWATTPRLSVWARGQFALGDPALHTWVRATLTQATVILAGTPPPLIPLRPSAALLQTRGKAA